MVSYQTYLIVHIGGSSLSGLAAVLHGSGHTVYGWEQRAEEPRVLQLVELGITVFSGPIPQETLAALDCVVHSSITSSEDIRATLSIPERTPVFSQFEFIDHCIRGATSIAITGSYGKTITTSLLSCMFDAGGHDVSFTCGGVVENYNSNAKLGTTDLWVVEAVETHRNCLRLSPTYGIVLNAEHADHVQLFREFIAKAEREVFINVDDHHLQSLVTEAPGAVITFGVDSSATFRASNACWADGGLTFELRHQGDVLGTVAVPGNRFFSIYNVLAACAAATHCGLSVDTINRGLGGYKGVRNRFDTLHVSDRYVFIKDIAHHPESIAEVVRRCREYHREQVIVLYRPHIYREINEDAAETAAALELADRIVLLDIESVKDRLLGGRDSRAFVESQPLSSKWLYFTDYEAIAAWLDESLEQSTVIAQMGMYQGMRADVEIADRICAILRQRDARAMGHRI